MSTLDYGYDDLDQLFAFASENTGLDSDLLSAVSMAESSHNPSARSPVGAMGLMQLMPATAADPGAGTGVTPFDPNKSLDDPEENVRFGADYLAYLVKRYDGDTKLALMAYNGGMGTVDEWLKNGADPAQMNKETREYPDRVQAALDNIQKQRGPTEQGITDALEVAKNPSVLDAEEQEGKSDEEKREDRLARASTMSRLTKPEKKEGPEGATQWIKDNLEWAGKAIYSGAVDTASLLADMVDFGQGPDNGFTDRIASKLQNHSDEVRQSMPDWIKQQLAQRIITEDENGELDFDMPNLRQVANLIFESAGPSGAIVGGGKALLKGAGAIKKLRKVMDNSPRIASAVSMGAANSTYVTADTYSSVYEDVKTEALREKKSLKEATDEAARAAALAAGIIAPLSFVTGGLGEGLASTGATMTKRLAKGLVYGSATEAPEEAGQLVAEELGKGKSLDEISRADVLEAGILGALGAGPVEGTMAALFGNDGKVDANKLDAPPPPADAKPDEPGAPPDDVPPPPASAAEPLNLERFEERGAPQPYNPNPEQLNLWDDTPTEDLPLMPPPGGGTMGVGATSRAGSRLDPSQQILPLPPNPAIAAGAAVMEESLDNNTVLPDAADALAEPNEEQKKGMFERAHQKLADELELDKNNADQVDRVAVQTDEVYRNDLTITDETLSSLPNVSSADAVEIDRRLQETVPNPEARGLAVEGLLEQLNEARAAEPEATIDGVLANVLPTQVEPVKQDAQPTVNPKPPLVPATPAPTPAPERDDAAQQAFDDQGWVDDVLADPEAAYEQLLYDGYTEEEAEAEISEILGDAGAAPANEAEAEYDRDKQKKGRMRAVTQPSEGQQQLRVTRTQPAVNEFEERLKAHVAENADPGQLVEDQVAGVDVLPGDVLDLWHGTTVDFDLHQAKTEGLSPGLWFSNNEKTADHYSSAAWAGQQDVKGPTRPRKMVVRAVPKNPLTVAWTEDFKDMRLYNQVVNEAKAAGHDMVIFTGIDPAFAGTKAGPTGKKDSEKVTQGVAGLDNYYVVLDKNILTHRPGKGTLMLTPEESAKMEMDQTAAERAKLDPADRAEFDKQQADAAAAAALEASGPAPRQTQLFRKDGKPTAAAAQPVAKTARKKKPTVAPDTKVADTSVRKTAEEQSTDNRFKMQQVVKVRKNQLKVLANILPEGSTYAASLTPDGLIFNTKEQALAFYAMMKENFQGKDAKMKGRVPANIMKSMMNVAMKVNKASQAETVPNPKAKPAPAVKKTATKKVAKKKKTRKKKAAPAPEVVTPPPEGDPESVLDTTVEEAAEPDEGTATRDTTDPRQTKKTKPKGGRTKAAKRRAKNQRPASADEVKPEEVAATEGADSALRGKPPANQTVSDPSPENADADSQTKIEETEEKLAARDPDEATEPEDVPGDREVSEQVTNTALQDMIYMHSGKWADLFYYWVANTEFMGLKDAAARYHKRQVGENSTARGDVAARKQYIADMKAWKQRRSDHVREHKSDPSQVIPFTEPAPKPPSKGRPKGTPGEFSREEFNVLYKRAMGRTKIWWTERMVDQHYAVKLINDVMADENGYVKDSVALYEALTRVGSRVDVLVKKFQGKQQADIEAAAGEIDMAFQDVNEFAAALHSLMRNGYMYRRNQQRGDSSFEHSDNPDSEIEGYSGISNKQAHEILAAMEEQYGAEGLAKVEDAIFAASQFLRSTMEAGGLASETQLSEWSPDEGGYIHDRYKELRDSKGYKAALDPANYDLTLVEQKVVEGYDFNSIVEAQTATLLDTLHNITYVPLSDIDTATVSEVVRQQILAKAGANFYSEYDIWGEDIGTAYGRQTRGLASAAVTHLLSHGQQSIIRSEHNTQHAQRIQNTVAKANEPYFGIVLPKKKEGYYNKPGNIKRQIAIEFQNKGLVPPKLDTLDVDLLTFRTKDGDFTTPTVIFDLVTANALTNSYTSTNTKRVFNAIGNSSMYVRKAMTAWSPPFIGTNFVREVWNAKIQARGIKGLTEQQLKAVQAKATFAESFRWMKTIFRQVKDPNFDPATLEDPVERQMAETFKQLHEAGMTSEFFHIKDMAQMERELRQVERALNRPSKTTMKGAKALFKSLGTNLELAAAVSENAVRMAVAAEVLNQTGDVNQAASVGKDLSVNFQRYGTWGSAINSLFFFYNPTVQGLYRAKRALHHKDVKKIVAGAAVFGAMMPLLNRMLAGDDDEGKNYYESVPHWKRSTNFIMMIPGGEGRHITIPLPYVWNLPYAMSEKLVDALSSDSQEAVSEKSRRIAGEMFGLAMENVSPVSYSSNDPRRTVVPTMVQPFYDVMNNQNWFGSYINPGKNQYSAAPVSDAWNVKDPDRKPGWQAISQGMAIGGSKYEAGMIDVSPGSLEYLFGYYTGGAGTFMTRMFDTAAAVVTGGGGKSLEENVAAAPILRRVYGLGDMKAGVRDRYYSLRGDMEAVRLAKKDLTTARDREGMQTLMANEGDLFTTGTMRRFEAGEKRIRKWVTARNRIIKKKDKTDMQLKQIEAYNTRISAVMKQFNQYYFDRIVSENL